MLIDIKEYSSSLKKLWKNVFGDSDEYINLLFDFGYTPRECFGEIRDGEVVSALYLLGCSIGSFSGRYLYAAATLESCRGQGIMSRLIEEAKEYIKKEKISFISLVPANDNLYGYYGKFGFAALMYNYSCMAEEDGKYIFSDETITDTDEMLSIRNSFEEKSFSYEKDELSYALSCLSFAGFKVYKNTSDSYYIANEDKSEILEYISSKINLDENTKLLLSKLKKGTSIVSPCDLSRFCKCEKRRYGMIYTAEKDAEKYFTDGVYMNIALD